MITEGLPSRGGESSVIMETYPVARLPVMRMAVARLPVIRLRDN
jgi:hypothetical protein